MAITNLHDAVDSVPYLIVGIRLGKNGELKCVDGGIERIIKDTEGQKPIATKIKGGIALYDPGPLGRILHPFYPLARKVLEWILKRKMKKLGANFAVVQYGYYHDCYDFYNLTEPTSASIR